MTPLWRRAHVNFPLVFLEIPVRNLHNNSVTLTTDPLVLGTELPLNFVGKGRHHHTRAPGLLIDCGCRAADCGCLPIVASLIMTDKLWHSDGPTDYQKKKRHPIRRQVRGSRSPVEILSRDLLHFPVRFHQTCGGRDLGRNTSAPYFRSGLGRVDSLVRPNLGTEEIRRTILTSREPSRDRFTKSPFPLSGRSLAASCTGVFYASPNLPLVVCTRFCSTAHWRWSGPRGRTVD